VFFLKGIKISSSIALLTVIGVVSSCGLESVGDEAEDAVLEENQRIENGNLTWDYLDQFIETNPTDDLSGSWVAVNDRYHSFYAFNMDATYDSEERYYYYDSIRDISKTAQVKTDENYNILDVFSYSSLSFNQYTAGYFDFDAFYSGSSIYRLKKISNEHLTFGELNISYYLYSEDTSEQVASDIIYYEEDWSSYSWQDYLTFSHMYIVSDTGNTAYFSLSGSYKYCSFETSEISLTVVDENCFEIETFEQGTNLYFNFTDTDGNVVSGSVVLSSYD
jgi:hypothetical protein